MERRGGLALLGALVGALALTGASVSAGTAAAGKCPRGQAAVTSKGKKSCRPLAAALPKPSKADERVVVAHSLLGGAAKTLGAKTAAGLERVLAIDLAKIDAFLAGKRKLQAVGAVAGCVPPGAKDSDLQKEVAQKPSGYSGDLTTSLNIENGGLILGFGGEVSGGGKSFKFSYEEDVCGQTDTIPKCPTADGTVDTTKNTKQKVSMSVSDGGKTVFSQTYSWTGTAHLHGKVADDAKLDSLDIDSLKTFAAAGTKVTGTIATSIHVRVDMRSGSYDPNGASVTFMDPSGASEKLPVGSEIASFVGKQIQDYHSHESGWLKPNACATIEFSPGVDKIVVTQGETGQLSTKVKAEDGAVATGGKWTLSAPENATFSPDTAKGPQAQFNYTVTKAGVGVKIKATLEATSPAGVAKLPWSEPTGGFQFKTTFTFVATIPDDSGGPPTIITFVHEFDGISCKGDPYGKGAWDIHSGGTLTVAPPGLSTPFTADVKGVTFKNGAAISMAAAGGFVSIQLIEGQDGSLTFRRIETPPPVPIPGGGYQPPTIDQTVPVTTDAKCPKS